MKAKLLKISVMTIMVIFLFTTIATSGFELAYSTPKPELAVAPGKNGSKLYFMGSMSGKSML